MMRYTSLLAAALTMLAGLAVPLATSAQAAPSHPRIDDGDWCVVNPAPPCILAASRNSVAITKDDPTYVVSVTGFTQLGEHLAQWSIADALIKGTFATLAPTDAGVPFSVTVDVGTLDPRVTDEYAGGVSITKTFNNVTNHWEVTVSGTAVLQGVNADCDAVMFTCPPNDNHTVVTFQGDIGDWEQWSTSSQWDDFNGLDQSTNAEETAIPPTITGNPFSISEQIGNSHELNMNLFEGFWDAVLPNAFLVDMGINDPSTLTPAGISASVGTGTVTVTPGPTSTAISITGITFSHRVVHIKRGTITPTAPTNLSTRRASATVGILSFHAARPRGSFVRSYQGRCWAKHRTTHFGTARKSPVKVTNLIKGVSYICQVRAKSAAGYGPWTQTRKLPA